MAYEIGLIVGENTTGKFHIAEVLSTEERNEYWLNQGKSIPHDKAYKIILKCGKPYVTLHTQINKCIQANRGWLKCYKCDGINKSCQMDSPISHALSKIPERVLDINPGDIFNDLQAVRFAFNKNRHNYWEFECIHCGQPFYKLASDVISGTIPGYCSSCGGHESKGARAVREWLEKYNFIFSKEKRFDDCRNYNTLPFDFAIYNKDNSLHCLIEYDGEQHFKFIPHFHSVEEGFYEQQKRDNIKTKYCLDNNIKLIRIPYTEFNNIDKILDSNLSSCPRGNQ